VGGGATTMMRRGGGIVAAILLTVMGDREDGRGVCIVDSEIKGGALDWQDWSANHLTVFCRILQKRNGKKWWETRKFKVWCFVPNASYFLWLDSIFLPGYKPYHGVVVEGRIIQNGFHTNVKYI